MQPHEIQAKLIGIARPPARLAPMEEIAAATVTQEQGIAGDARGAKRRRQVSILFKEDWEAACRDVPLAQTLPWITRRANLLVEGMPNPRAAGGIIRIGEVVLEVVCETEPCDIMEKAQAGLKAALTPGWRGGVCCKVVKGGTLSLGDLAESG